MENVINVLNEKGESFDIEVLDIFGVKGYEGKDYILYTMNKELDEENIECFISIIEKTGDLYKLVNIDDDNEFAAVKRAVDEMEELENE